MQRDEHAPNQERDPDGGAPGAGEGPWADAAPRTDSVPGTDNSRPGGEGPQAGADPALRDVLRDEILAGGPITFARFMERALYEPGHGYYMAPEARPGRAGDFLTSPEAHWLFGRTIARQVAECWERLERPSPFTIREYGAGRGALAAPLLAGMRDEAPDAYAAVRYEAVEANPHRLADLRDRLVGDGLAGALGEMPERPPSAGATGLEGVVLANEFLDALPVHRVERRRGELVEIGVGWRDGRFVDAPMPPSPGLAEYLRRVGAVLDEGQQTEVNLGIRAWLERLGDELARGWVFAIDYGLPAAELHAARRPRGTLKGVAAQHVETDPYAAVGRQDLTAHVDLTELELAARDAGFEMVGRTSQGRFLVALGLGDLLVAAQARAGSVTEALETRSAAMWLLDPRRTGGFEVTVLARGVRADRPLRGLDDIRSG